MGRGALHVSRSRTDSVEAACLPQGVNVTLGLPFPRTSPDHGTAFEIAGKGIARPDSMIAAINLAVELAAKSS